MIWHIYPNTCLKSFKSQTSCWGTLEMKLKPTRKGRKKKESINKNNRQYKLIDYVTVVITHSFPGEGRKYVLPPFQITWRFGHRHFSQFTWHSLVPTQLSLVPKQLCMSDGILYGISSCPQLGLREQILNRVYGGSIPSRTKRISSTIKWVCRPP